MTESLSRCYTNIFNKLLFNQIIGISVKKLFTMRTNINYTGILLIAFFVMFSNNVYPDSNLEYDADSIIMNPSYVMDVFYSFENGTVGSASNTEWDIAFYTNILSAGIITNGARGVELKTYLNADTSGWNNIDTTGLASWPMLYNDETIWEEGAFNRNSKGLFDYGWGVYNISNHNVVGDSIFIIKYGDNTYKKLWIVKKVSMENIYHFKFANLDNSGEVIKELDCKNYSTKNFVYYDFEKDEIIDREPVANTWDLLFTKYMALQPTGTYYPVTGVLINVDVFANEFQEVAPNFSDWASMPFDTTISTIGWDWKVLSPSYTYDIKDSLAYFVNALNEEIYKLVFTKFEGYQTGKVVFNKSMVSGTFINKNTGLDDKLIVSPIPATEHLNISFIENMEDPVLILLFDITGKKVYENLVPVNFGNVQHQIPVQELNNGLYILILRSGQRSISKKVMVN